MNSRERVLLALNHKEPDRVPFDMGATLVTGISIRAYRNLRKHLGMPDIEPQLADMVQQIAQVDDDIAQRLELDVRNVSPNPPTNFKIEIQDAGEYQRFHDEFNVGWRMPKDNGLYYDMFEHPFSDKQITEQNAENFNWPNPVEPSRFAGVRDRALKIRDEEKRAVVIGSISTGIMEIYARLRGFENFFIDFAQNKKVAAKFLDRILELRLAYWERMFEEVGDLADVVDTADDLGAQNSMLISPRTYRELVKPRHKELFDFIHKHSNAKIFFHSCGAIRPIIPDLIEIGCDILNPVQVSAKGMDSAELKQEFGRDLVFWGGGVDTQAVLGSGTPQQVRDEVKRRLNDLMPGGGFVFNAVHNIQANVPVENIIAMFETVREYGKYGNA